MKINQLMVLCAACMMTAGTTVNVLHQQPTIAYAAKDANKKVNQQISDNLKQCQDWAAGNIDKDGKKTDHGTANLAYQWATYITAVKYDGHKKLTINVNNNFDDLQDNAKRDALNSAENCANQVLIEHKKISAKDANKGLTITVRDGHGIVGRSDKLANRLYDFN